MPNIRLGNGAPLDAGRAMDGRSVTTGYIADHLPLAARVSAVTSVEGIWRAHSTANAPLWVASDDQELADALAEHYQCPQREWS